MSTEYRDFLEADGAPVPAHLSNRILDRIQRELNPSALVVFSKLMALHLAIGAFTLSICPQLGFRLLGQGMGLMHYFMAFGEYGCMVACGGFFLGMSMLAAAMILRPEELKVLRKNRWLEIASLAGLSFAFFFALNPEIALGIALAWLMGSMATGLLVLEFGWRVRVARYAHA